MELRRVEIEEHGERVRLVADVSTERSGDTHLWIEAPAERRDDLVTTPDPWLVALLPLAVTYGEALRLPGPVDPPLLEGVHDVMDIWASWYREIRPVPIEVPGTQAAEARPDRSVASCFSGGVDSFFTLLGHRGGSAPRSDGEIDTLVHLRDYDVREMADDAHARMRARVDAVAAALGKRPLHLALNWRRTCWFDADFTQLSHGSALAAVALALGRGIRLLRVPTSLSYTRAYIPWGSHPLTDRRFSTSATRIDVDGSGCSRVDRLRAICGSALVQQHLHVCREGADGLNCERCAKCVMVMLALEVEGVLPRYRTFPSDRVEPHAITDVTWKRISHRANLELLRPLLIAAGRRDLEAAIGKAIRVSERKMARRARRAPRREAKNAIGSLTWTSSVS